MFNFTAGISSFTLNMTHIAEQAAQLSCSLLVTVSRVSNYAQGLFPSHFSEISNNLNYG